MEFGIRAAQRRRDEISFVRRLRSAIRSVERRVERRILKHYRHIARNDAPLPSLLLVQAPIFHGYAFAVHIVTAEPVDVAGMSQVLAGDHVTVTHSAEEWPSNVSAAGQNDVQVSVLTDVSDPNAIWLWAAADNLRIAASTAVECAETMAASLPRGKIQ